MGSLQGLWWHCVHHHICAVLQMTPKPAFLLAQRNSAKGFGCRHFLKSPVGQVHMVKLTLVLMTWSLHLPLHMGGIVQMCRCKHAGNQGRTTLISVQRKRLSTHTHLTLRDPCCRADLHPRQIFRKMATDRDTRRRAAVVEAFCL